MLVNLSVIRAAITVHSARLRVEQLITHYNTPGTDKSGWRERAIRNALDSCARLDVEMMAALAGKTPWLQLLYCLRSGAFGVAFTSMGIASLTGRDPSDIQESLTRI